MEYYESYKMNYTELNQINQYYWNKQQKSRQGLSDKKTNNLPKRHHYLITGDTKSLVEDYSEVFFKYHRLANDGAFKCWKKQYIEIFENTIFNKKFKSHQEIEEFFNHRITSNLDYLKKEEFNTYALQKIFV